MYFPDERGQFFKIFIGRRGVTDGKQINVILISQYFHLMKNPEFIAFFQRVGKPGC